MMITLVELVHHYGRQTPDQVALIAEDRRITYREFSDRIGRTARKLMALGVRPGDRVAVIAENSPEYLVVVFAIWQAGGIAAAIYPSFGLNELSYAFRNAEPRMAFVDADRRAGVEAAAAEAGANVEIVTFGAGDLLNDAASASAEPSMTDAETPALICYTSGTSSRPKPVAHSHVSLCRAAESFAETWRVTAADVSLVVAPLAWLYGLITSTGLVLCRGGTAVLVPRFFAPAAISLFSRERVTIFVGVTTMYVKMLEHLRATTPTPRLGLRFCISGGEPRNEAVFEQWREVVGTPVHDSYCGSESFPLVSSDPDEAPPPFGSSGRLMKGAELRLIDPEGNPVAPGAAGEALTRGPALMLRYWNEPELTSAALTEDGWFRTRDYLRIDEQGFVYVVGRASDMIIRGGANISPLEVEAVLNAADGVEESVVLGLPDPRYGQVVAAAVVAKNDTKLDPETLRRFCAGRLAAYKVPTIIRPVASLPRNESGKVVRRDAIGLFQ